jgi:hypothetical protein
MGLGLASQAAIDHVLAAICEDEGELEFARGVRALPVWERPKALLKKFSYAKFNHWNIGEEMVKARCLSFVAGLPLEFVRGQFGDNLHMSDASCTWLPSDFVEVPGNLDLRGSQIRELPDGLDVQGNLDLPSHEQFKELPRGLKAGSLYCVGSGVRSLPQDLIVRRRLNVSECPLARLSDRELRAMAPGVADIRRPG